MLRSSRAVSPRQDGDQALVSVGNEVGGPDHQDEADKGGTRGEPHAPPSAAEISPSDNPRNTDQHGHGTERSEVADLVEGSVDVLGEHDSAGDRKSTRLNSSH